MIKVILLSDKDFIGKMEQAFNEFLPDRISVKCFSPADDVYDYIKNNSSDILITDDSFEIDHSLLPAKCASAYFSDSINTYMINGEMALFIYQNISDICNSVMNIIDCHLSASSETENDEGDILDSVNNSSQPEMVTFFSCTGGSGGSVFSKAFSVNQSAENKKVLYVPLEICTSANTVFTGGDSLSLSDIFHDISTGKDKTILKKTLSRAITHDESYNVYFIPPFYTINDIFAVTEKQFIMFMELLAEEDFSVIVMDADFSLQPVLNPLLRKTDSIVMLSNGTEHSNLSIDRIYNYINFVGEDLTNKINIIYNRFVNGTSKIYTKNRINILGGIGKLSKSSRKYVIDSVAKSDVFSNLQ